MSGALLLLVCLAAGALLRRARGLGDAAATAVVRVVVDVALPALTFRAVRAFVPPSGSPKAALALLLTPWLAFAVVTLALRPIARRAGWSREEYGALAVTAGAGNTAFVGYPVIEALYGREGLSSAVLLDQGGSFPLVFSAGATLAAFTAGRAVSPAALLRRIATFPSVLGSLLALALRGVRLPVAVEYTLERLAGLVVPLALVGVGLQLALDPEALRSVRTRVGAALALKLVAAPALALALAWALGLRGAPLGVLTLEAAMPPMVTAAVIANEQGLPAKLTAPLVAVGALASVATLPCWALLLRALGALS